MATRIKRTLKRIEKEKKSVIILREFKTKFTNVKLTLTKSFANVNHNRIFVMQR